MKGNIMKKVAKWVGWIVGIWLVILAALEIFLTSSALTGLVNRIAAEFIDGELSFGKVELSMFRRFPSASLSMEDFVITYPADRFDEDEKVGAKGLLYTSGCGEISDTLASFERFTASVRLGALLTGKIGIPYVELSRPRIHAHQYTSGRANWDIFKLGDDEDEPEDTTSSGLPAIMLGKIRLNGNPRIVYTDNSDTLAALINLKQMGFNGRLNTRKVKNSRIGFRVDSLFAAGRMKGDTLAFGLDHLGISERNRKVRMSASAKTFAALRGLGRFAIPIEINGEVTMPGRAGRTININSLTADIAKIPMSASGEVSIHDDRLGMDIKAGIDSCRISDVIKGLVVNIVPEARNITTDAIIDFHASAVGDYIFGEDGLPAITASFRIPDSGISYKGIPERIALELAADASTDSEGRLNVDKMKAEICAKGAELKVSGSVSDLLCNDPKVYIDGNMDVLLDSLATMLPDSLEISAKGKLLAEIKGNILLSQMDMNRFSDADVTGRITAQDIDVAAPKDTLKAYISKADISLSPEEKKSKSGKTFRMLGLKCLVDSTDVTMGTMEVAGKQLKLSAMNSADYDKDTSRVHRFGGKLSVGRLILADNTGMVIGINGSDNGFQILPKRDNPKIPVLTFTSRNKSIFMKDDMNRIILSNATVGADATMNTIERRQRVKAYIDSLARKYPEVSKDSLLLHAAKMNGRGGKAMPEWLKEDDFKKQDINFRLDETFAKYFREWDLNGKIAIDKGMLMTPLFPLRNTLQRFEGYFNNNQVRIDTLGIKAGKSELAAKGALTGIQKILSGRGRNMLNLDVDITSNGIDANELLKAYTLGSRFNPEAVDESLTDVSDEEYMELIASDTTALAAESSTLLVVPANLNADIRLDARNIKYSDLAIEKLTANAIMKERCLQITNTSAVSNFGDISFDGFYATRSKKDIKTGFNIQFDDITAENVISLMPAVDSLMPILKSFYGRLNCEIAATAQLDTNMNILTPSINGIMRITGDDLAIKDSPMYKSLARKLLFKNKKEGHIEHMSVEGIISNSTVEIFPFIIKMDRYTLALSGIQNLDMSFKYHASLIKSPFLIKLGLDIYGEDFDNWKFKIGKPKYKNADVPAFSSVIDETKVNLVQSIKDIFRKGVDAAIKDNNLDSVNEFKRKMNYVRAVDQQLEALSEEEQKKLEEEEAAAAAEEAAAEGEGKEQTEISSDPATGVQPNVEQTN